MALDASAGCALDHYQEVQRACLVHETDISYLRPLVCKDRVIVETWVPDFHRFASTEMIAVPVK